MRASLRQAHLFATLTLLFVSQVSGQIGTPSDHTPLSITIAQAYPVVEEGEPIMLNVTLKNVDPSQTIPILTTNGQNGYLKNYYYKIYDAGSANPELRWEESRAIQLLHTTLVGPQLKLLAPGEQIVFSANLNDYPRFYKTIESHHALPAPMFAGQYKLVLIYDRSGNPIGDSLNSLSGMRNAPQIVESAPFVLHIHKTHKELFPFQSINYQCKLRSNAQNTYDYTWDGKLERTIVVQMDSSGTEHEVEMDESGRIAIRTFTWFPSHEIKEFHDRKGLECHAISRAYRMRAPEIWEYHYVFQDDMEGIYTNYDAAGRVEYIYGYELGSREVSHAIYKVINGVSTSRKTKKILLEKPFDPCGPAPAI